jgi:type 1 glutamine amidotransferase
MRNLILSGGPFHNFDTTSRVVAEILALEGISSDITDDVETGLAAAASYDIVTLNLLRWRMLEPWFDEERGRWAMSLSTAGRDAFEAHLARGRGLLALHTATVCFDDWTSWGDLVGAHWDWERSSHPPPRPSTIRVRTGEHPIVDGVSDFEVVDEIYSYLNCREVTPLMTSMRRGEEQPLLWVRPSGGGHVVYDALGHDERSIGHPCQAAIIRQSAAWLARLGG